MIIFDAEKEAGLGEKLSNNSIAFTAVARETKVVDDRLREKLIKANLNTAFATNKNQPDLYYLDTILVSTGWNKNDDVFDLAEVWAARNTPEDKPFNYEHNEKDIIGHITANFAVDDDGGILADDLTIESLPASYHLQTSAVLYRSWQDEKLKARMDEIVAEIPNGEWFVSMEALFTNFDYAIIDLNTKAHKIVARNHTTAFLTKHLRQFGGTGVYQNQQLGRVLRGITFSGKGLVRKPANPNSVILTNASELFTGQIVSSIETEKSVMSEPANVSELSKEIAKLNEKVVAAEAENKKLADQIKQHDAQANEAKVKAVEENNKAKDAQIADLNKTVSELNAKLEAAVKEIEAAQAETKNITEAKEKVEAAYEDMKKEKEEKAKKEKAKSRLDALVAAGVDAAKAQATVDSTDALSDEAFANFVALIPQTEIKTEATEEDKAKAAEVALAAATPEAGATLNDSAGKTAASELQGSLATLFSKRQNLNKVNSNK